MISVKSSGIKFPDNHGIGKILDPKCTSRKTSHNTYDYKSKGSFTDKTKVRTRENRIKNLLNLLCKL